MFMARQNERDIDGYLVVHRLPRMWELPLDRFCNLIWYWATRNADQDGREKLESDLWQPPEGEIGEGVWSAESETNALSSLKQGLGV